MLQVNSEVVVLYILGTNGVEDVDCVPFLPLKTADKGEHAETLNWFSARRPRLPGLGNEVPSRPPPEYRWVETLHAVDMRARRVHNDMND